MTKGIMKSALLLLTLLVGSSLAVPMDAEREAELLEALEDRNFLCDHFGILCPDKPKPNIILMVADDMGVGDLASYGHPTQEPGFIDEMAANGMRFTDGYTGDSVCTPSRSSIMTGKGTKHIIITYIRYMMHVAQEALFR